MSCVLDATNVLGLETFGALFAFELDFITFVETAEAFTLDCGEVDEYILAIFSLNEAVAFGIVEPLALASECRGGGCLGQFDSPFLNDKPY